MTIPAIETRNLTRRFGDRLAVDSLSLSIPEQTVFGFLGPNGAGKTTTVRMLAALIAPTSGTARVAGHSIERDPSKIHGAVGLLTEAPGLYERLSARENLVFFGELYGLSRARANAQAERYLRLLQLWDRRDEGAGTFSKGMRQKLAIARALLHEPAVLFLDEPTAGLDPESSRVVRDFIKALRAQGRTILLTTHNLPEADELCDLVGIFKTRLIDLDTPARLRARLFGRGTRVSFVGPASRWEAMVRALPFVRAAHVDDAPAPASLLVDLDDPDAQNPLLLRALINAGAEIRYAIPEQASLEEVYLRLIGHGTEGGS